MYIDSSIDLINMHRIDIDDNDAFKNEMNNSIDFISNNFKNPSDSNKFFEKDEESLSDIYFLKKKKTNQQETEEYETKEKNDFSKKKENILENKPQQKNPHIIQLISNGIPSEKKIDGKGKNEKKRCKKQTTEETAYSSEKKEDQQDQFNKVIEKKLEISENNKEENNNPNKSNNNKDEKNNDAQIINNNIEENNNHNIINNNEENIHIIISNDINDTNTNKSENIFNNETKRDDGKLNSFNHDKIRKKIRTMSLSSLRIFINGKIKNIYNNNICKSILIKQLLQIGKKKLSHSRVEFDKEFLLKTLKEIFSEKIREKYSNYQADKNKQLVEELINSEIGGDYFKKLFKLTFLDCLEHIRGTKNFNELDGLMNIDEMLNYEKFEIDKDDIGLYKTSIFDYEKIIREKKPRKSRKEKNNV